MEPKDGITPSELPKVSKINHPDAPIYNKEGKLRLTAKDLSMDFEMRCHRCGARMKQSKLLAHLKEPEPERDEEVK